MYNLLKKIFGLQTSILDYETYAEKCVEKLKVSQDKFLKEFDINSYKKWFYNQDTRLLTLKKEENEVNFKFFNVGSFSNKSNTWKWSWDNDSVIESNKKQTKIVKAFGLKSNYLKLTNGYFESNEVEAWEFAAIALKIGKGIGVYRAVADNQLQIYFVIIEHVSNEVAQKIKDKYVDCDIHDSNRIAFVCQHLNKKTKVGFEEAFVTIENMKLGEDDDFQAWCNECEKIRVKENGWSDYAMEFADIKLVCEKCYFEMKEINS
jgi:hypothetical protein